MIRETDVRDFAVNRVTPDRVSRLQDLASGSTVGHTLQIEDFDPITGNPSRVRSIDAPAVLGNYVNRALDHLRAISPVLGFEAAVQAPEFLADPDELTTSSGAVTVHTQQLYRSIPIYGAAIAVRFGPDGALDDTGGAPVTLGQPQLPKAAISAVVAVRTAAEFLAAAPPSDEKDPFGQVMTQPPLDVSRFVPTVRAAFANRPEKPTTLAPGPFAEEIKANLLWYPLGDRLALAWVVLLTLPDGLIQYDVFVDASTGEILRSALRTRTVAAHCNCYRVDGGSPRNLTPMPRNVADYGLRIPSLGQDNWRWCSKCQGLHYGGHATHGVCPAGGAHNTTGGNYRLVNNCPGAPGEHAWRWCQRCEGLFFSGGGSLGVCPAGGAHVNAGGNYALAADAPLALGQDGWRRCHKCETLFFGPGNVGGPCPGGGAHDGAQSRKYTLANGATTLPAGFPGAWVGDDRTTGNNVLARIGADGAEVTGTVVNGVLTFDPADATGDDQKVLNIFYYNNVMHDLFYALGFAEADGNFQQDNLGRGGSAADRVEARVNPLAFFGTASMRTPVDGSAPTMIMGLVGDTNRHTAFDSTVVFHEYTHGVTDRLVGGPMNLYALSSRQSCGMAEGWSDYVACTVNDTTVVASWALDKPAGIRGYPYDSNYPSGFDRVGTDGYKGSHNVGEIWCATLMEMNRRTDKSLVLQLVVDSLKLSPANPSFLQVRDAMFRALDHMRAAGKITATQHAAAWQGMASAFARFNMGPRAATSGPEYVGIVGDPRVGQDNWRWCGKCGSLYFGGHAGHGMCPAGGGHMWTENNYDVIHARPEAPAQDGWRWCSKCAALWFSGHPTQGVCPAGGSHDGSRSGAYKVMCGAPGAWGENQWRKCSKCANLWYSGRISQGVCAADGTHTLGSGADYVLITR